MPHSTALAFSTLDLLPDPALVCDAGGVVTYVNDPLATLLGRPSAEIVGRPCAELTVDGGWPCRGPGRIRLLRADGHPFLADAMVGPLHNAQGAPAGCVTTLRVSGAGAATVDALHRLHSLTSDPGLSLDERIGGILELGATHFELPLGIQSRIEGDRYTVERCRDPAGGLSPGAEFELSGTYCALTLAADQSTGFHHVGESDQKTHPCYLALSLEAYLGAPIVVSGVRYGTLNFSRPEPCPPFTSDDLALIELLADWVGKAIEEDRSKAELHRLATTDPLTGLFNRRAYLDDLEWQLHHGERSELPLTVVLCDLDRFKAVNDAYGHEVGDRVLQAFAETAVSLGRVVDRVCRFGGEEFAFTLPDTDRAGAETFARRLQESLPTLQVGDAALSFTGSFGVAEARAGETASELLARADRAMYEAKRGGRAQVRAA